MPSTTNSAGKLVSAVAVREVAGLTTTDEAGRLVPVTPVRYVGSMFTTDSLGRPIDATPVVAAGALITLDDLGRAAPVLPVRTVAGLTTTDERGRPVPVLPVYLVGGGGGGGGGNALSAPVITRTSGPTTYPATFDLDRPMDWPDPTYAIARFSADPTFATGVTEGPVVTINAVPPGGGYDFGLAAKTATSAVGSVFWGVGAWDTSAGARPGSLNWSNPLNVGDVTGPTIASSTDTIWANLGPVLVTVTANEPTYFTLGGTDAALLEKVGSEPTTSIGVRLSGNANTNYDVKPSYAWTVSGVDIAGNPGNTLSRTDTVLAPTQPQWANTNGVNKSQYVAPSGSPRLVATGTAGIGAACNIRNTISVTGKRQFEITVTTTVASSNVYIGIDDGGITLGPAVFPIVGNTATPNGVCLLSTIGGSKILYGKGGVITSGVTNGDLLAGDVVSVEFDTAAGTCSLYRTRSGTTVQVGSTVTGITFGASGMYAICGTSGADVLTANFGTSAFTRALSSGYSAYNA